MISYWSIRRKAVVYSIRIKIIDPLLYYNGIVHQILFLLLLLILGIPSLRLRRQLQLLSNQLHNFFDLFAHHLHLPLDHLSFRLAGLVVQLRSQFLFNLLYMRFDLKRLEILRFNFTLGNVFQWRSLQMLSRFAHHLIYPFFECFIQMINLPLLFLNLSLRCFYLFVYLLHQGDVVLVLDAFVSYVVLNG